MPGLNTVFIYHEIYSSIYCVNTHAQTCISVYLIPRWSTFVKTCCIQPEHTVKCCIPWCNVLNSICGYFHDPEAITSATICHISFLTAKKSNQFEINKLNCTNLHLKCKITIFISKMTFWSSSINWTCNALWSWDDNVAHYCIMLTVPLIKKRLYTEWFSVSSALQFHEHSQCMNLH